MSAEVRQGVQAHDLRLLRLLLGKLQTHEIMDYRWFKINRSYYHSVSFSGVNLQRTSRCPSISTPHNRISEPHNRTIAPFPVNRCGIGMNLLIK